ncbi:MAG TPA: hypothetical protein VMQ44_02740 [Candidatus Saccharimonadales bacterium]|nr:hypothetical protein [Candidatus Saccharimonadales bacterium]
MIAIKKDQQPYFVMIALVVILIAGGGYWLYKQNHKTTTVSGSLTNTASTPGNGFGGGRFGSGQGGNRDNFSRVSGTLTAKTDTALTIKDTSGATDTVTISSTTRFNKSDGTNTSIITLADLAIGDTINAMGTKDSSGSITARMVFDGVMPTFQPGQNPSGGDQYQPPTDNSNNGDNNAI